MNDKSTLSKVVGGGRTIVGVTIMSAGGFEVVTLIAEKLGYTLTPDGAFFVAGVIVAVWGIIVKNLKKKGIEV